MSHEVSEFLEGWMKGEILSFSYFFQTRGEGIMACLRFFHSSPMEEYLQSADCFQQHYSTDQGN